MIDATCGACGTVTRVGEADLPIGAKFITCSSCKSRVALPPSKPAIGGRGGVFEAAPPPPMGGNRGDVIDLADLPAPKRGSPLAGIPQKDSGSQRGALDLDDLLAPAGPGRAPEISDLPAPRAAGERGPRTALEISDLPAPKSAGIGLGPSGARPPASKVADLPAPKASAGLTDLPAPKANVGLTDLPAPRASAPKAIEDLPAPKASARGKAEPAKPSAAPPTRGGGGGIAVPDLPAPKRAGGLTDLPAPKASSAGFTDLPAPKASSAGFTDLPAPKASSAGLTDLPAPKRAGGKPTSNQNPQASELDDLLQPVGSADLPAPKGFFDDLPQPATNRAAPELPAPKGFFDDLPQPATNRAAPELPAPKGFFDDLPQPSSQSSGPAKSSGLPAPKGFFDDLPQPSGANSPNVPAPKGFFDDLPQPSGANSPNVPAPKGFFENLPARTVSGSHMPDPSSSGLALDLHGSPSLDLQHAPGSDHAELDLGAPITPASAGYDDLDLSAPTAQSPRESGRMPRPPLPGAANEPAGQRSRNQDPPPPAAFTRGGPDIQLQLEEPRRRAPAERERKQAEDISPATAASRRKRQTILLAALLGLAAVTGGGYFVYHRHAVAQERSDELGEQIATARAALTAADPGHWQRALAGAKKALEDDEANPDALGIAAEAAAAGALDDGVNAAARTAQANKLIAEAREAGVTSNALDRAIGVAAVASGQADRAIAKLKPLQQAAPKDGLLALYMGWSLALKGDQKAAMASFETAMASPNTAVSAQYGRGRAKLALGDLEGARADFAAVLKASKDHIGAQVALAAAAPPTEASQQETDLLAILARKDIDSADPRARVLAWTLAGDDARRGNRLDAARERYHKALAIEAGDVAAITGLAEVELRDNKLDAATDMITKALTAAPNDVRAQLVYCEIALRENKLDDVAARIKALAAKDPPPTPLEVARIDLIRGKLLDARGDSDGALAAWTEGAKLAGELDLAPTMAAVAKLGTLAKTEKDPAKASAYRDRADQLLGPLGDKAATDANLALTLGAAYLDAGDPGKAEPWLRKAAEARTKDPEPKFELAKVLVQLNRADEAVDQLRAAIALDASRADIGLELAKTFEAAGREADAATQYDQLLAAPDPAVELRARAGRFFARTGQLAKATPQADAILTVDPTNPAGLYLKGEQQLAAGQLDEAGRSFQAAVDSDPDPQYLDGQGRAAEARATASGDGKYVDLALHAYEQASEKAPAMFNPLAGQGRLLFARNDFQKAAPLLVAANKLRPDDADVMYLLGRTYEALGFKPAAIDWLAKTAQLAPKAETYNRLGDLNASPEVNQAGPAVAAWDRGIKLALEEERQGKKVEWLTDAYFKVGLLKGTLGDQRGQAEAYEKYLGRNPPPSARSDEARRDLATKLRGLTGP